MSEWMAFDNYQLALADAERQAEAKELAQLRRTIKELTSACQIALDALDHDGSHHTRLLAQRTIRKALEKVE